MDVHIVYKDGTANEEVQNIRHILEINGFSCHMKDNFQPGKLIPESIQTTVRKCKRMLLILSETSAKEVTFEVIKWIEKSIEEQCLSLRILLLKPNDESLKQTELQGLLGCIYHCEEQCLMWTGENDTEKLVSSLKSMFFYNY